jgi:hypothetical protein
MILIVVVVVVVVVAWLAGWWVLVGWRGLGKKISFFKELLPFPHPPHHHHIILLRCQIPIHPHPSSHIP